MKRTKLIIAYGKKFSGFSGVVTLIMIVIAGLLIAFSEENSGRRIDAGRVNESILHPLPASSTERLPGI